MDRAKPIELILHKEYKIHKLLPGTDKKDDLEASGVYAKDDQFFVIFDSLTRIAKISNWVFTGNTDASWIFPTARLGVNPVKGFEDITFDRQMGDFLVLVEAAPDEDGVLRPCIDEYDENFQFIHCLPVDFVIETDKKGFEGLTYSHRDGKDYVLGLCEGNQCRGKKAGRVPGGGRIQILERGQREWRHLGTLNIPTAVTFEDYSSIDIMNDRVAIVSQESSVLWVGKLQKSGWGFVDNGLIYPFPRDGEEKVYGNVEGVCWISDDQVVVVSDKKKEHDPGKKEKDQSIHVFEIPHVI
jgi:hypothetical protein